MIRIGGRSKNENLSKYLLKNLKFTNFDIPAPVKRLTWQLKLEKQQIEAKLTIYAEQLSNAQKSALCVSHLKTIAAPHVLRQIFSAQESSKLSETDMLKNWLISIQPVRLILFL